LLGEPGTEISETEINQAEAERILKDDSLFRALVVQRSRAYVRKSQEQHGESAACFPIREKPRVINYSIKKTYGKLLDQVDLAFMRDKPLFTLASYYPLAYYIGPNEAIDPLQEGRQKQVVALIRTQFLKRFESSVKAFEISCMLLLQRILAFQTTYSTSKAEKARLEKWRVRNQEVIDFAKETIQVFAQPDDETDDDEDFISDEVLHSVTILEHPEDYKISDILADNYADLEQLVDFLHETRQFRPSHDDKLSALKKLLEHDPTLKNNKVLIFTEYMHTARYLKKELEKHGFKNVDEVDSSDKRDRGDVISRFAPYYNEFDQPSLPSMKPTETNILISTDVLSEGLNLQDATFMINYDLHWNPVRLMQRIGRVDRRMNPEIEARMLAEHPERKELRCKIVYWNFLPPEELDRILKLYARVSHKTLRISKVFGIEGRKLLKPDDDFDALKDFTHIYEGTTSTIEEMHLEYQRLLKAYPDLESKLNSLPGRVFSGKQNPSPGTKAVFFCYALPAPEEIVVDGAKETIWSEKTGHTNWYIYNIESELITDEPSEIISLIRSEPTTPRRRAIEDATLSEIRIKVEKHIKNSYFKKAQAPIGVKAILKAWMELS
jgi:superfamily II DNA/RNA helicase